ncbi:precorrin-6A synthase (deacetylating) [Kribbella sandramycini]|uniref:Precorrin-6A synthase n=1 Tax=Kribbella sandramycini TaxID=60450 RepID=A0A7Y4P1S0_9ACTN|nr:precorrin-6A synthase (deacetylating) [Kribbella sandramycini]MBB6570900.1 precorrin-6A synthase [Kribbella sandramycini]NOL44031.1 precorrin-6A synthase (deacetylating) [Kribbella sandramycini]
MREIVVIGIGAGDPDQVTLQAVKALGRADVFFVLDKGDVKQELVDLRTEILSRHASGQHRVVVGRDPERDRTTSAYVEAVDDWRRRRADVCAELIAANLGADEVGAFLVWGDPSLYDSTLAILDDILARGAQSFAVEVIPGISSVSTLAARHRIPLNQVGRPVQITTGRRLAQAWPDGVDDVVVMLDAQTAFSAHTDQDADIYWGAYLGTPDELLIAGPVSEVAPEIEKARAEARDRKGWIMDTYLLRRRS